MTSYEIVSHENCRSGEFEASIFVGIHGNRWVRNAISSIERQDVEPLQVVAAVNGDWPLVVDQLREWQASTGHCVTIALNGGNLGPLGSWYANQELLTSPWVAFLHQDDEYSSRHVSTLLATAQAASEDVLAVFSAMEGIDETGRPLAPPPMDNSFLDLAPTETTLPAILRRHPLPTPTLMLRNPEGYVDDLAWYDSGAPDSEWFARLACRGRFRVLSDVTVRYRMSAGSESHSTGWESRAWQWAQSLDRLINSEDLMTALISTPLASREAFARDLLEAIPARYQDAPIFGFLKFSAAQRMAQAWGYPFGSATQTLADFLATDATSAALRNVEAIAETRGRASGHAEATISALLGESPARGMAEEAGRAAFRQYGHLLPRRAQRALYRAYDRLWAHRGAR